MGEEETVPTSFKDLLNITLRLSEQETKEWESNMTPMDNERRKWLSEAMEGILQNDDIMRLKEHTKLLGEVDATANLDDSALQKRENAFEELDFLVERADNAKDLHLLGGFRLVIQHLCSPYASLRWRAAQIVAVATQNNPFCQAAATQLGAVPILLLLVSSDEEDIVRVKAMYALSGLVKSSDIAGEQFHRHRGFEALHVALKSSILKLRIKTAFFIRGLLAQDVESNSTKVIGNLVDEGFIDTLISLLKREHDDSHEFICCLFAELLQQCDVSIIACVQQDQELLQLFEKRKHDLQKEDPDRHGQEIEGLTTMLELCCSKEAK